MTPFMHIVRTKRLLLAGLVMLACVRTAYSQHRPKSRKHSISVLSTSGNSRRDSKVRPAAAEASLLRASARPHSCP